MKSVLLVALLFASATASATCNLNIPTVQKMVTDSLKSRTSADLSKEYWFNNFKSNTYSVFMIQFKQHDQATNQNKIHTLTTSVSCNAMGAPMIDSSVDWSIALGDFPSQ